MNIITLNETRSTLIKGLLIQSLPPITKPQQRVLTETIDGRDGDRLTLLGYAAYDKTVQIGLCGDYDVDEVIQYFVDNMSGKVIFSNEPDKYYRYTIVKQIDFERLLRFKQAKVVFHVQPFKFSAAERTLSYDISELEHNYVEFTNSGNTVCRPVITIFGSGNIVIKNASWGDELEIALGDYGYITIDTERLEAYKGDVLLNRIVIGDYQNFIYQPGRRRIYYSGTVTYINISNYSRWI